MTVETSDQGHVVPVTRFVAPAQVRTTHNQLESVCQLLNDLLMEVQRGNSIERTGAVSSVEIKFLANGTPQPVIKCYAGSVPPVDEAIEAYGRAVLMSQQAIAEGWEQTVEVLQREREAVKA